MVDVGQKSRTRRRAVASAQVTINATARAQLRAGVGAKGDVLATVRVAAIQAAKKTAELIPLCHVLALDDVQVAITHVPTGVLLSATVTATGRTGVEMEALTAVSVGALTLYDMLKAVDRSIAFEVRLEAKTGGKSGRFRRPG